MQSRNSAIRWIIVFAAAKVVFHYATDGQYGFHRDELATLFDARHLAWGYVAYPPVTPFFGRLSLMMFGESLAGFRFFGAVAQSCAIVLSALIARELRSTVILSGADAVGGQRRTSLTPMDAEVLRSRPPNHLAQDDGRIAAAQWITAIAVAISPVSLASSALLEYVTFDFLWWVLIAYFVVRLINTDDGRWWIAIGAAIGLGVLTKYTIAFYVAGIVVGVLATPLRRWLRSKWLWIGAAVSVLIAAPNLMWQTTHQFVSLEFLQHIHARDVRWGRTDHFLIEQLYIASNPVTVPLWLTGLFALFFRKRWRCHPEPAQARSDGRGQRRSAAKDPPRRDGGAGFINGITAPENEQAINVDEPNDVSDFKRKVRALGWMAVVPFILFVIARGRGYYMAAAYPFLVAAGAVVMTEWVSSCSLVVRRTSYVVTGIALLIGSAVSMIVLPLAPAGSKWWRVASDKNGDFREEIGWPELTAEVARIWQTIPTAERARTAIYCDNYGEAGALDLYGPGYGLPHPISGINSFWYRGYGDPPPQTVIVLGEKREGLEQAFTSVVLAGHTSNHLGVKNEETDWHPDIFICRGAKMSWPELWKRTRGFG